MDRHLERADSIRSVRLSAAPASAVMLTLSHLQDLRRSKVIALLAAKSSTPIAINSSPARDGRIPGECDHVSSIAIKGRYVRLAICRDSRDPPWVDHNQVRAAFERLYRGGGMG